MNMFRDDAVIAYYRAAFTTEAAFTQIAAIQSALVEIQKDLVNATIASYDTSDEYLNDTMAADITSSESVFLIMYVAISVDMIHEVKKPQISHFFWNFDKNNNGWPNVNVFSFYFVLSRHSRGGRVQIKLL